MDASQSVPMAVAASQALPQAFNAVFAGNNNEAIANMAMQEEFAKHGVSWRAQDARDAGLSPLAGLGGGFPSFQPVQSVGDLGNSLQSAGQDFARAALSGSGQTVRDQAHQDKMDLLAERKGEIEINLLQSQLEKERNVPPPFPDSFVRLHNSDGSITLYPSHEAASLGFFHPWSHEWALHNKLIPTDALVPKSSIGDAKGMVKDNSPLIDLYSR